MDGASKEKKVPLMEVNISYMSGTISGDETLRFKKIVFRASRGKALTYLKDLDPSIISDYAGVSDKRVRTVYVIVF